MALVIGNIVVPAGVFNAVDRVADLSVGTLCPEGLRVGVFNGIADVFVNWNDGNTSGIVSGEELRLVAPYSGTDGFFGKTVRLTGHRAEFIGTVIQQLDIELDDTNGDGTPSPVCVVQTENFTYLAEPASLEEYA